MDAVRAHEDQFLKAAVVFAKATNVPMTKVAWALSSLMETSDSNVLYRMKQIALMKEKEIEAEIESVRERLTKDLDDLEYQAPGLEQRLGEVVIVEVVSVRTYGAVCKVEGTTRTLLLHLSEIADAFIDDVSEYLEVGDKFPAMLIVNNKGQLALSARRFKSLEKKRKNKLTDWEER